MALARAISLLVGLSVLVGVAGCDGDFSGFDLASTLGVGEDQNLLTPPPAPRKPKPKPTIAVVTPKPSPSGPDPRAAYLRRNLAFDSVRSQGITQVYDGKTTAAVGTFKKAQSVRPDDQSVKLWLDAIEQAAKQPKAAVPGASDDFRNISNGIRGNAVPGAAGAPGGFGAVGAPPALPRPGAPAAAPSPLDPRLVF